MGYLVMGIAFIVLVVIAAVKARTMARVGTSRRPNVGNGTIREKGVQR